MRYWFLSAIFIEVPAGFFANQPLLRENELVLKMRIWPMTPIGVFLSEFFVLLTGSSWVSTHMLRIQSKLAGKRGDGLANLVVDVDQRTDNFGASFIFTEWASQGQTSDVVVLRLKQDSQMAGSQ